MAHMLPEMFHIKNNCEIYISMTSDDGENPKRIVMSSF